MVLDAVDEAGTVTVVKVLEAEVLKAAALEEETDAPPAS